MSARQRNAMCCALTSLLIAAASALFAAGFETASGGDYPPEKTVAGVAFPGAVNLGGRMVPRRGAALLEYWRFDVYAIALYAPPEAATIDEVLDGDSPRQLVIHYFRSIESEDIIKAARKLLEDNPDVDVQSLQSRLDRMNGWYVDVSEGDEYRLSYIPGVGSQLHFNGELLGTIPGEDFGRAYFGIWLSEHPLDEKLRDRLLGGSR